MGTKLYLKWMPFIFAGLSGGIAAIYYFLSMLPVIAHSKSSTAAIGYVLIIPHSAFVFCLVGCLGYCLGRMLVGILDWQHADKKYFFLASAIVMMTVWVVITYLPARNQTMRILPTIPQMNAAQLEQVFFATPISIYGHEQEILLAIVNNPQASASLLDRIAHLAPHYLQRALLFFYYTANNPYAVNRLIASHPNITPATLTYLSHSQNFYVLNNVASNSKTPRAVLIDLYKQTNHPYDGYLVSWGLAANPNTPPFILRELAKKD